MNTKRNMMISVLTNNVHCFFPKHTFFKSDNVAKTHTRKCCQILSPMDGFERLVYLNCTNLLDNLIVSRVGLAFTIQTFPEWVLVRTCKHIIILPKNSRYPKSSMQRSKSNTFYMGKSWCSKLTRSVGWVLTLLGKKNLRLWF
jgi:hypothetical protein